MATKVEEIEREIHSSTDEERNHLLRDLMSDLDGNPDHSVEEVWLEEARRRLRELQQGDVEAISAEEVLKSARDRLKDEN